MKTAEDIKAFIKYRDSINKELRGGVMMYDVKNHYKWLTESELLQHWVDHVYQPSHPTLPSDEEIYQLGMNDNTIETDEELRGFEIGMKQMRFIASPRIAEMEREIKRLQFMIENGLGAKDIKNDI